MIKRILLVSVIVYFSVEMFSCSSDGDGGDGDPDFCTTAWALEVQDELNDIFTAAQAYSAEQTTATCTAYKAAYTAYVDALEPFLNCAVLSSAQKAELQAELQEARDDAETLCDE